MNFSIIMPVLNEACWLEKSLDALLKQDEAVEIIVCDGGSTDATVEIATRFGATVLETAPGRGIQIRAAAARARGDVLVFVHADTLLAPGALSAIGMAFGDDAIGGGNFRVIFDGETGFARWLTGFYGWLRSNAIYYGDSVIFVRRAVYEAVGGVRPIALMEDFDFVRRMEREVRTIAIENPAVVTSSRRFSGRRPWRIFSQWVLIHGLYFLGAPGQMMARIYRSALHTPSQGR